MLITRQSTLDALCGELRDAAPIAFDTEFIREKRYWPQLCLVQVRAGSDEAPIEALIDPFEVSLRPLLDLFADETVLKIVHAGSQDLEILSSVYGCEALSVFDTQIAAAFLGFGFQVGYAELVSRAIPGVQLSKGSQYSDWAARPLSSVQLEYARADVKYLPRLHSILEERLRERGRLGWAHEEFRSAESRSQSGTAGKELYSRLKLNGLSRRQLAVLRELAIERDLVAQKLDKPAAYVVPDPVLIQMARQPPASPAAFRSLRGSTSTVTEYASDFLAAIRRAQQLSDSELPPAANSDRADPQAAVISGLLALVAQARAAEHELARQYLAPADQLNELAAWSLTNSRGAPPEIPLLQGWRRELLGEELLELLAGRIGLSLDPDAGAAGVLSPLRINRIP